MSEVLNAIGGFAVGEAVGYAQRVVERRVLSTSNKKDLPHRMVWSIIAEVMGSGAAAAMLVASAVEGNSFGYGLFVGYMAQKWEVPKMLGKYWEIMRSRYPSDY